MFFVFGFSAEKVLAANIGNEFVSANINGSNGTYNFGLKQSGTNNWYNISYAWPSDPGTSFTSVRIDNQDYVFGNGGFIQSPRNLDGLTNEALWKKGDVSVRQVIQVAQNPATGRPDAVQIKYVIVNTGQENHDVGLRIMIDTMLQGNDGAPFRLPGPNGMEAITKERDYRNEAIPDFWQAFRDLSDPDIAAQYTLRGGDATPPDRLTIAAWGPIRSTEWDFTVDTNRYVTSDSATGMWWNPQTIAPGETKTLITYYGQPRVGGTEKLTLSCPTQLPHSEWSQRPFNVVAYLNNNTNSALSGAYFTIDTELNLPENDQRHNIGGVEPNRSAQTNWLLQPTAPGIYPIRVNAYHLVEGEPQLFATYETRIEALPAPVPENVTLRGTTGTTNDGTPVAGRVSPLTIEGRFPGEPTSVSLIATDRDGTRYTANMTQFDNVWRHTFTPSQVGLWEAPLNIKLIPHYADGSDGTATEFKVQLIDPSGFVYNSVKGESWRLPNANVELQYYDPDLRSWVKMDNSAYPGRMLPVNNPQITGNDGRYGWDVAEGQYRVVVRRNGFSDYVSNAVNIPPAVTDLNIPLVPTDFTDPTVSHTGVNNGDVVSRPVSLGINGVDIGSGIRSIVYRVDNGEDLTIDRDDVNINITSNGNHIVTYKVTDYAGNETTGTVNFTIDTQAPVINLSGVNNGETYQGPVTIQLNTTDEGTGIQYLAYKIDNGTEVVLDSTSATIQVITPGNHNIYYRAVDKADNETTGQIGFNIATGEAVLTWLAPLNGEATISTNESLDIGFKWTQTLDKSVSLRIRNAATGSLIVGYTYGAQITYNSENKEYHQTFEPSRYKIASGTRLKVMIYFGGKLRGTTYVNVN